MLGKILKWKGDNFFVDLKVGSSVAQTFPTAYHFIQLNLGMWHSKVMQSSQYSNDAELVEAHTSYLHTISSTIYEHRDREHLFIVKFHDTCDDGSCHSMLLNYLSSKKYNIVNAKYGQIFTHASNMEALATTSSFIESYVPMIPELKIEKDLGKLMKNCQPSDKSKISVHVAVGATSETLLLDLKEAVNAMSCAGIPSLRADLSGLEAERSGMMTVSCTCEDLSSAVNMLSQRPEIVWIEHRLDVVTHNRWARGVCQTGSYENTPLYNANLTGQGHIIGIVDTGMDMFSCHLYDPKVAAPYDIINFKHRKVITYKTSFGDKVDDKEAHGTHVGSSAAGAPYLNYGDYRKYSGIAYNAKIAFIDIGNTNAATLSIPPDLYNQVFKPLYETGARIFTNSWGSTGSAANKYTAEAQNIDKFMVDYPDTLIFFAAGNEGDLGYNTVGSPSTNKNGISAGASLNDRQSWQAYSGSGVSSIYGVQSIGNFSSKGPTADGRRKPDLFAP
eukprot:gene12146-25492_t